MASGKQKGIQNLTRFIAWAASQSADDFKAITFRGQLNRVEIAKAIGCAKSALNQNPALKQELESLEDKLRLDGILPQPIKEQQASREPQRYDQSANKRARAEQRASALETEVIELKAKVTELEARLLRYGELSQAIAELGLIPR